METLRQIVFRNPPVILSPFVLDHAIPVFHPIPVPTFLSIASQRGIFSVSLKTSEARLLFIISAHLRQDGSVVNSGCHEKVHDFFAVEKLGVSDTSETPGDRTCDRTFDSVSLY